MPRASNSVIPFVDLKIQHAMHGAEISGAIQEVIDAGAFSGGPFVERFEADFAAYCGSRFAVGVGSGTEALWLALISLGVGPGDEVITVPNTFIATVEAITNCGARPVFVDVDEETYTLDPNLLAQSITPRTKAVIPVHLFGQIADMDAIMEIAGHYGIRVIEDACQAHGAEYKGRKAGTLGDAGCFSFYPGKNLGALGEAGAIVTNDARLNEQVKVLRNHGQVMKHQHLAVGWNARMDGIQAAVLLVKLTRLDQANAARRQHAQCYKSLLGGDDALLLPREIYGRKHVYHVFSVRTPARDRVIEMLDSVGIQCGIHYPVPVHLQKAYEHLKYPEGTFPVAEQCAKEFLSLPMFPELTRQQIDVVSGEVKNAVREVQVAFDDQPKSHRRKPESVATT